MRIAVVRHTIQNRGADRMVYDHINYLISRGHKVSYYTSRRDSSFESHPDIEYHLIPGRGAIGTLLFTATHKFTEEVVLVDLIVMAVAGRIGVNPHMLYFAQDYDVTYYSSAILRWFTRRMYSLGLKGFKIPTITVSEALTQNLMKYDPGRTDIITVNNGIDLTMFSPRKDSEYTQTKGDKHVILLYARSDYRKGMDVAEAALNTLTEICDMDGWEVWVIGEEFPDIDGITVRNFGFLDEDHLANILSAADIYFMSSRSEGLSTLLLQAIACRCAVVATTVANIIQNEEDGLIVEIEDEKGLARNLKRLIEDPALLDHYQERALQLARYYSIEDCQRNFADAIEKLAEDLT